MSGNSSPTFCIMPWVHLHRNNGGNQLPCCIATSDEALNSAAPASIEQRWNSADFLRIRKQMLNGEKPAACRTCYSREEKGLPSLREGYNEDFAARVEGAVNNTSADGATPIDIVHADFRIGNLCNLKCRMCSPDDSRLLGEEWRSAGRPGETAPRRDEFYSEEFLKDFFIKNPNLSFLRLAGGETFITPRILWLLDYLVKERRAHRIALEFHTNLTVLPDSLMELLAAFRSVSFMVSVDGFDKVNSYIRYPAKWAVIDHNIRKLDTWARLPFVEAKLSLTLQAYNSLQLDEFLKYTLTLENFLPAKITPLMQPVEFDLGVLPMELQREAIRRLEVFSAEKKLYPASWKGLQIGQFENSVQDTLISLRSGGSPAYLPEFIRRTIAHDRFRKQHIADFIPALAPVVYGSFSELAL